MDEVVANLNKTVSTSAISVSVMTEELKKIVSCPKKKSHFAWFSIKLCLLKRLVMKHRILCFMTNRFNKHDFIENQAKLDIFDNFRTTFLTCLNSSSPRIYIVKFRAQNSHIESRWQNCYFVITLNITRLHCPQI